MIHIIGNYYAKPVSLGYELSRYTGGKDKDGNKTYKTCGYFGNLEELIQNMVRNKIHDRVSEFDMELEEVLRIIREEQGQVKELLRKAMDEEDNGE